MARIAWTFTDPVGSTSYSLEINPGKASGWGQLRNTAVSEVMPDGTMAIVENPSNRKKLTVSGTILTQGLLEAWDLWARKGNAITLTDDLGRSFSVWVSDFRADRERKVGYPWYHTFTAELTEAAL